MRLPKRFALSTLLLVMLMVSLVFGYAAWRKQSLVASVKELRMPEVHIAMTDDWLWPTLHKSAGISIKKYGYDEYGCNGTIVSSADAYRVFSGVVAKMKELGVEQIDMRLRTEMVSITGERRLQDLEEIKRPFYGW